MLYLHVPFCRQACHYCNFHFSTSLRHRGVMVEALLRELELQRDYLGGAALESVYFGGGTPSLLTIGELEAIFKKIGDLHTVLPDAEITLEANPDDLTDAYLNDLKKYTPVNRLSIGIQSFSDDDLRWMNRAHNAAHARHCLDAALRTGFDNLTLDLIYGAPTTSDEQWAENLRIALDYQTPHLSSYCLTVEDGTALGTFVRRGQQPPVDEERAARQFEYLMDTTAAHGYEHYEISNFALPGRHARHNSNYWRGAPYLGIGPSAHSFDGQRTRQWNVANNAHYLTALGESRLPAESETLSDAQRYNEYVLTMLRTKWGCSWARLQELGAEFAAHFQQAVAPWLAQGAIEQVDADTYRLTRAGRLLADRVSVELFV